MYLSVNELENFEFHDAYISEVSLIEDNMIWQVAFLNATVRNSQNNESSDLCINHAKMEFTGVKIEKIEFLGCQTYNSEGALFKETPSYVVPEKSFSSILKETAASAHAKFQSLESCSVVNNRQLVCFCIDAEPGVYYLTLSFDDVSVTWNDFSGLAWYEKTEV